MVGELILYLVWRIQKGKKENKGITRKETNEGLKLRIKNNKSEKYGVSVS